MRKLGLTGGIGAGKSEVAERLKDQGGCVIDTDALAREFTRPGQAALEEIVRAFGPEFLDDEGALRRDALAARIFGDSEARRRLERILHPLIQQAWQRQLEEWQTERREIACVVIPLLYETGSEGFFDAVLCTACTPKTQRERLRLRGWSDEQIDARLEAQIPMKTKMERADHVIWTEGSMESTREQLRLILNRLDVLRDG